MIIEKDTDMLLFRYSNYKRNDFISEHHKILTDEGFVWMLKLGKRSSIEKLRSIKDSGGWLLLRAPKAEGSKSYVARFIEISEEEPEDMCYPAYYNDILDGIEDNYMFLSEPAYQWFKLVLLEPMQEEDAEKIVVSKSKKKLDDVISTTRTAVMFVKNDSPIEVRGVNN